MFALKEWEILDQLAVLVGDYTETLEELAAAAIVRDVTESSFEADVQRLARMMREADWESLIRDAAKDLQRRRERYQLKIDEEQERLNNAPRACDRCHKEYPRKKLVSVDEGIKLGRYRLVCVRCQTKLRAKHQRTCALCGVIYMTARGGKTFSLCRTCATPDMVKEDQRVASQLVRASNAGLAATLTLQQWLHTLEHFQRICAYCQAAPFTEMDHFIAVSRGGGTTWTNCVPSCESCNMQKGTNGNLPQETMERVGAYLLSLSQATM